MSATNRREDVRPVESLLQSLRRNNETSPTHLAPVYEASKPVARLCKGHKEVAP